MDTDRHIRDAGREKFKTVLDKALNLFDYKLNLLCNKYDIRKPEDKVKIAGEFLPTLSRVSNAVLKSSYAKKLTQKLEVNEEDILSELRKHKEIDYDTLKQPMKKAENIDIDMAEKIIITLVLENNKLVERVKGELAPDDFSEFTAKRIMEEIFKLTDEDKKLDTSKLIDRFEDKTIIQIISSISVEAPEIKDVEKNLRDCIKTIKKRNIKKQLRQLERELKMAQEKKSESRIRELTTQFTDLLKKEKQLAVNI
jgi:DNA primase